MGDGGSADSRISSDCWMARAGTDYKLRRLLCYQLVKRDLVVAENVNSCAFEDQVLVDIPGERVIVVDENEIGTGCNQR